MNKILSIFINLVLTLLPKMTKAIRIELIDFLKKLEVKAKATPNPVDDLLIAVLLGLLVE